MKTLTLRIDDSCEQCRKALRRMTSWQKPHKTHYGSAHKKTGELVKGVVLRPDYNSCGNRTHYHIENE